MLHFGHINFFFVLQCSCYARFSLHACLIVIFASCCLYQILVFRIQFFISHYSFQAVALLVLPFFMRCHSSCIVVPHVFTLLALLLFSCRSFRTSIVCYSFHTVAPTLLFPSHSSPHTIAHFRYMLAQSLLFFFYCRCCSSHATIMFCLVSMVFPLSLPCVSWSLEL